MALVVYDMQVGIPKQIKNPEAIVAKISRVLEAARAAGVRTFFMRHMSLPKELMICVQKMGPAPSGQLFRNIVFASEMADTTSWHVVNLVRGTQGDKPPADPTNEVCGYLRADWRHCFTFRTWESLHGAVVSGSRELAPLDRYLRRKSAHFRQAFLLG
jgi:nicotinamidase-related amidase